MALSDLAVRRAKPSERPYRLSDERGLYLLVQPDGARWWRLDFTLDGKRRTMSLGVYPDVELGDARDERDRVRKLVKVGVDPVQERRAGAGNDDASFKALALKWMEAQRPEWTQRNYDVLMRRLERLIFPEMGSKDVRLIEPTEMLRVIRKIEASGTTELPRRMNGICGRIFRYAIAEGLQARDPTRDISDALNKEPPKTHRAFIRPAKMGEFLVKLADDDADEQDTVDAMRLLVLTATRTAETRFADCSEFEDLDSERPLWRIPKERMKRRLEHVVPLSPQAAEIVKRRIKALKPNQTLLFGRRTASGVISENTLIYCLYRLGYRGRATVHGFRSTFSTLANEATKVVDGEEVRMWEPDWIERALAHVEENKVRGAYNAAEYLPQRRRLLRWWATWLDEQLEFGRMIG